MNKKQAVLALCASVWAFSAQAATFCVKPGGTGGCSATIQAAVTLADGAAGDDVIKIAAGTYPETVTITTENNLALVGSGAKKTIIDPAATGISIVDSDNVQILGIAVHNATGSGISVDGNSPGLIMKKSEVQNAGGDCVLLANGAGAVFEGNRFAGCGDNVVDANAAGANGLIFKKNRLVSVAADGLDADGNNMTGEGNVCELFTSATGDCIEANGNGLIFKKNTAIAVTDHAVNVTGDNMLAEGNKALGGGTAVSIDGGSNPVVLKNTAQNTRSGVIVVCSVSPCAATRVEGNKARHATSACFSAALSFDGGIVLKNKGSLCRGGGMTVSGAGTATVESNTIAGTGPNTDAFSVSGAGVKTLSKNKASAAGGDGFEIAGGMHTLTKNVAKGSIGDGFVIRATADMTNFVGNTAKGNGKDGFENEGQNNFFDFNKASGNAFGNNFCTDVGAGGTSVFGSDNDFGAQTPPAVATVCVD